MLRFGCRRVKRGFRLRCLLMGWIILGMGITAEARPRSDTERLIHAFPEGFSRPVVSVFPIIDMDSLKGRTADAKERNQIWVAVIKSLRRYRNLRVRIPRHTVKRMKTRIRNDADFRSARQLAEKGLRLFGNVRLEDASRTLTLAVQKLVGLRYDMVDPQYVSKLIITRGQALLESKKTNEAKLAFTQALSMYPSARLDPDLDHPNAVSVFEATRIEMLRQDSPL